MRSVVDLINVSPSIPLNDDVPEIAWKLKDISYSHLIVFDWKTFVHIHIYERFKHGGKSKQFIFLDYGCEDHSYRFWDPVVKKVI